MSNTSVSASSSTQNKSSSNFSSTSSNATISEATRNRLNQISNRLSEQLSKKGSNVSTYIKFESDGCRKVIKFDPARTEEVQVTYPGTSKAVNRVNLYGNEIVDGKVQGSELACWTASATAAKDVIKMFKLGCVTLDIIRHRMDKSTYYDVQPA